MKRSVMLGTALLLIVGCGGDNGNATSNDQADVQETQGDVPGSGDVEAIVSDVIDADPNLCAAEIDGVVDAMEESAPDVEIDEDQLLELVQELCANVAAGEVPDVDVVEGMWRGQTTNGVVITASIPATAADAAIISDVTPMLEGCMSDFTWAWVEMDNTEAQADETSTANLIVVLRDGTQVVLDDPISFTNECETIDSEDDFVIIGELADEWRNWIVQRGGRVESVYLTDQVFQYEDIAFITITASPGETVDLAPMTSDNG